MQPPDDEDEDQRTRINYIVLAVVAVIVVLGVVLMLKLSQIVKTSDCVAAGHRNCAPVEMPQQQ